MQRNTPYIRLLAVLFFGVLMMGCLEGRGPEPFAPQILEVNNPTETSVDIVWSSNYEDDFVAYRLFVGTEPEFDPGTFNMVEYTEQFDTSATVDGLDPATRYYLFMEAEDIDGFVSDLSSVRQVSTMSWQVVETVAVGERPFGVAFLPGNQQVVVSNNGSNTVSVLATLDWAVEAEIEGLNAPYGVVAAEDSITAYVANGEDWSVAAVSTETDDVTLTADVNALPVHINLAPGGELGWVTGAGDSTLTVLGFADGEITLDQTLEFGKIPFDVVAGPFGDYAYVSSISDHDVTVLDQTDHSVVTTIPVGMGPQGLALTPTGDKLYVANANGGTVSVIDTETQTVTETISVGRKPSEIACGKGAYYVYVTNFDDHTVSAIRTWTGEVAATIEVGMGPVGIAISRDGRYAVVANNQGGTVSIIELQP